MNRQISLSRKLNSKPCEFVEDHDPCMSVKQHLSMSPSEIARMSERGIPVSSQNMDSFFYDGTDDVYQSVPIERVRGVDAADVWEAQQSARKKMLSAQKRDIDLYGE